MTAPATETRAVKERPILFSGPMVRAILAGTKTQTRRAVKVPWKGSRKTIPYEPYFVDRDGCLLVCDEYGDYHQFADVFQTYGVPGDRLWIREAWCLAHPDYHSEDEGLRKGDRPVRPDGRWCHYAATDDVDTDEGRSPWRPSIHMSRWASRLTLTITDVRVERLRAISEEDARAEGVEPCGGHMAASGCWTNYADDGPSLSTARESFATLWESIHGPESWDANPWVWCICFEVAR